MRSVLREKAEEGCEVRRGLLLGGEQETMLEALRKNGRRYASEPAEERNYWEIFVKDKGSNKAA